MYIDVSVTCQEYWIKWTPQLFHVQSKEVWPQRSCDYLMCVYWATRQFSWFSPSPSPSLSPRLGYNPIRIHLGLVCFSLGYPRLASYSVVGETSRTHSWTLIRLQPQPARARIRLGSNQGLLPYNGIRGPSNLV